MICDLEPWRNIDLQPDREPATVEAWLRRQPQIEVVARDWNGSDGAAVTRALPRAVQVADRWHLLDKVSAAFLAAVRRSMPTIRRAVGATELDHTQLTAAERLQYEGFRRRQQTNETVRCIAKTDVPIKRIVRAMGLSSSFIRRNVRGKRDDALRVRRKSLTPWLPRLEREWGAAYRNASELWRRLRASGFGGPLRVVVEWVMRQRRAESAVLSGSGKYPHTRRIARLTTSERNPLSKADVVLVAQGEAARPAVAATCPLVDRLVAIVRNGTSAAWRRGSTRQRSARLHHSPAAWLLIRPP